jgi:hypothetical protein
MGCWFSFPLSQVFFEQSWWRCLDGPWYYRYDMYFFPTRVKMVLEQPIPSVLFHLLHSSRILLVSFWWQACRSRCSTGISCQSSRVSLRTHRWCVAHSPLTICHIPGICVIPEYVSKNRWYSLVIVRPHVRPHVGRCDVSNWYETMSEYMSTHMPHEIG